MDNEIAVIGAGLGGLTCALALLQSGHRVRVYEQAAQLAEVGAGITLSPNASKVLIALGLGEGIDRLGFIPERQWTQNLTTGEILVDRPRGANFAEIYGSPYTHLHRADLHQLLVSAVLDVDPEAIKLNHQLVSVTPTGRMEFAGGNIAEAKLAIGADGLKSTVREQLFNPQAPRFTGQVAWRGVVNVAALGHAVAALPPGIWIGEKRLFMRYPMRAGTLINCAAFVQLDGWDKEGWMIRSTRAELLGHYADAEPRLLELIGAIPEDQLFKWALHARDPLGSWTAGRVTLLGDAAHAMLPFMGQGAATAIEDGMVLARCLASFEQDEALQRYEAARRDRTTEIQEQSRLLGQQFQGKKTDQFGKTPIKNEETLGLFAYDATTCAI